MSCRPSSFARAFNARAEGCAVTSHAARKWLVGEAIPTQERILVIAKWLNVNASWLRFGEAENAEKLAAQGLESVLLSKVESDLVRNVSGLSKLSQVIVYELVESLRRMENAADAPGGRRKVRAHRNKVPTLAAPSTVNEA